MELDTARLLRAAGQKVFARGVQYFERGHVELLALDGGTAHARVFGSEDYRVSLLLSSTVGSCSCPAFEDSGLCKHVVAVALALQAADADGIQRLRSRMAELRERVAALSREELEGLVLQSALYEEDADRAEDWGDD